MNQDKPELSLENDTPSDKGFMDTILDKMKLVVVNRMVHEFQGVFMPTVTLGLKVGVAGPDEIFDVPQEALVTSLIVTSYYQNSGMMYKILEGVKTEKDEENLKARDELLQKIIVEEGLTVKVMALIDSVVKPKLEEAGFVYTPPADWKEKTGQSKKTFEEIVASILYGASVDDVLKDVDDEPKADEPKDDVQS